ncbi:hypothetical protein I0E51_15095 [Pseudomonas lalucatii]|nr:hypothetical protein [Pseudomonas lalucatii]
MNKTVTHWRFLGGALALALSTGLQAARRQPATCSTSSGARPGQTPPAATRCC